MGGNRQVWIYEWWRSVRRHSRKGLAREKQGTQEVGWGTLLSLPTTALQASTEAMPNIGDCSWLAQGFSPSSPRNGLEQCEMEWTR